MSVITASQPSTAFMPTPIESPGGGRIRDKRDPAGADLVTVGGYNKPVRLHRLAAAAWSALVAAARAGGISPPLLLPVSGYRSSTLQKQLWERALARYGTVEEARRWVAPPGSSAHESGRAIDLYLGSANDSHNVAKQRQTPAYAWLIANATRFGFYPYDQEPWHWEYNPAAGTPQQPAVAAPQPAEPPWSASEFTRAAHPSMRMRRLVPLLDKYRGEIPLAFLLGWIDVESAGRIDVITALDERGFFQIHPAESHDRHFDHQRLTTDPDYSVQAGIENVRYYARLAQQRFPSVPPGSELFWRLVKYQHAMGSGLARALVNTVSASGDPLTWDAIKQAEVIRGPRLHRLLGVAPLGRFARNVDRVFARGAEIARQVAAARGEGELEFENHKTPPDPLGHITIEPFPGMITVAFDPAESHALQTCINQMATPAKLAAEPSLLAQRTLAGAATLPAAVVDLTDPAKLAYAGRFDDDTYFVGSLAKIAPMYAAFELRVRVQRVVNEARAAGLDVTKPNWQVPVIAAIRRKWRPAVKAEFPHFDQSFPDLNAIFEFVRGGTAGQEVRFKRTTPAPDLDAVGEFGSPKPLRFDEWLTLMILWSNDHAADRVITTIGFSYLNGLLHEAGLFTPAPATSKSPSDGVGIWVSGSYGSNDWKPGVDMMKLSARGTAHYKATTNFAANARQVARLLTVAATGTLFGGDSVGTQACTDMVNLMVKGGGHGTVSFIADALHGFGVATNSVSSKIGIGVPSPRTGRAGAHDCAIVGRTKAPHTALRYVCVGLGGFTRELPIHAGHPLPDDPASPRSLRRLWFELDRCVAAAH